MSTIRKFKICPQYPNNPNCTSPEIIWGSHPQILKNCIYKDGCIEVSILEDDLTGLRGKCIPYTIICKDCSVCEPIDGVACFCDNGSDCTVCENCVEGICAPKCPDKICKEDGTCVDCVPGSCPGNQECIDGRCQCPPNKPNKDENGNCYACESDAGCPPCFRCDGAGNCVPRDCAPYHCDPLQDKCVECTDSSHCGKNEICCADKTCCCSPGFERNILTGICEPKAECDGPDKCGPCEHCVEGKCTPIVCPAGFKCENGDCVPDPCNSAPCENGADCGPECGCKGEVCTECAKLSCEECTKSLGCVCNESTNFVCAKVNKCDDNPCVTKHDCSEDCGCDKSVCQECANYSCEECGKIPGCKCTNGKCQGDGDKGCKDTFTLKPIKCEGKLEAVLTKTEPCQCSALDVKVQASTVGLTYSVFKNGKPLVSNTSVYSSDTENVLETGSLEIIAKALNSVGSVVSEKTISKNLASLPVGAGLVGPVILTGLTQAEVESVTSVNLIVSLKNVKIRDNKCIYGTKVILSQSFDSRVVTDTSVSFVNPIPNTNLSEVKLTSDTKRDPLFVWFRSKDSTFDESNIVKKSYVSGVGNIYKDTLTLEQGFLPKFDYHVKSECTCAPNPVLEDVVICEDKDLDYKLSNCNKKIELLKDVQFCDASNYKLAPKYLGKGSTKPNTLDDLAYAQVKYLIEINGTVVETLEADEAGKLKLIGKTYEVTDSTGITSLRFFTKDGSDKEVCILEQTFSAVNNPLPTVQQICNDGKTQAIFSGANVTKIKYLDSTYNPNTSIVLAGDGEQSFVITYSNGCELDYKHTFSCCDQKSVTISKNGVPVNIDNVVTGLVSYNLSKTGFAPSAQYIVDQGSNIATIEGNTLKVNADNLAANSESTITVKVSEGGCDKTTTLKVVKQNVSLTVSEDGCSEGTITLSGDPFAPFEIKFLSNGLITGNLDSNGNFSTATQNGVSISGVVYSLTKYKNNIVNGVSVIYTKLGSPTITALTLSNFDSCSSVTPSSIKLKVTGTGLSTATKVTYEVGSSTVTSNLVLEAGLYYLLVPNTFTDQIIITLTNVENTGCSVSVNSTYSFFLKQQTQVDITGSCNGTTNYQYVLSSLDADSIAITSALPAGASYNSVTKTLTTNFNSSFNITVTTSKQVGIENVVRCPITLLISSPASTSCACTPLPNVVTSNGICKVQKTPVPPNFGGYSFFKVGNPIGIVFNFSGHPTALTYNPQDPFGSTFVVYVSWTGQSPLSVVPTDYTFVNNVLTIKEFAIPTLSAVGSGFKMFIQTVSLNLGSICEENTPRITTSVLEVSDVTYVTASSNSYVDAVVTNSIGTEVFRESLANLKVNKDFFLASSSDYELSFEFKSGIILGSIPSNYTITVVTGGNTLVYTKQNIIDGQVNPIFLSASLDINVSAGLCHSEDINDINLNKEGETPITILVDGLPASGNFSYCRNQGNVDITHEFTGQPGVTTTWNILGQTSSSSTFSLNLADTIYPASPSYTVIGLQVVKDGINYSNTNTVYIRIQDPVPLTITYSSDLLDNTGTYVLPVPSGVSGSWRNSSNVVVAGVDTNTLAVGTYTFTFTPTTGCYQPFVATIKINSVGTLNISGPSTGCESATLVATVGEAGVVYYSKGSLNTSTVPPTSSQAISNQSVSAGDNNITITSSGTYNFVFVPNSNPTPAGYSSVFVKAMTISTKSNLVDDTAIPSTLEIGQTVALPTSVNSISGVWKYGGVPVTVINNTTTDQTRVYTFEPTGCYNNFVKTVTIVCPTDKTISITGLTDPCSATLSLSSDFYDSFSTLINGSIVVVGTSLARASFSQDSNTIQVTASKTGTTCQKVFNYTYEKCATCTLGVCDPCAGNSDTVVTVLNSSPFTNNSIVINTPNNIAITSVTKTSSGPVSATVGSQTTNDKTVTIFKTFTDPCGDAGLDTVTINYNVILNTSSGTVLCPKTFSYNYTIPATTYIDLNTLPSSYAIQDSNWVQVSGYGQNISYNSTQTFTVSGPDLVDGTVEFILELLADNYAAVSVNGNAVGSVGISGSNTASGFTSIHQFTIDKADLLAGSNSIEITHYNANEVMGLYIKIYRVVNEVIDSTIYNARTDKPILDC